MDHVFSIRQSDNPVVCACALCGTNVRWAAGPRLCVDREVPAVVCRDCGRTHAAELSLLLEGIEAYPGERADLLKAREHCLEIVMHAVMLKHGDPASLAFLRAIGALEEALPRELIDRAIEAAFRSNPEAVNKVRIMPVPTGRLER